MRCCIRPESAPLKKSLYCATIYLWGTTNFSILNCRSIAYMYDNNFSETLTPTHLMFGYEII